METEIRYYFSKNSEDKIINYLKKFKELKYDGVFYEKTMQYNHPMKEYDFYDLNIDGRFRIRRTTGENINKGMITWKRRLKDNSDNIINREEEIEILIKEEEINNLIFLIENVIHMKLIESYERYRHVFKNEEVEIVVDNFPFGIALEIESKVQNGEEENIIYNWINKIGLKANESYKLSWDDKYNELCKLQNKKVETEVSFDKDMPQETKEFNII